MNFLPNAQTPNLNLLHPYRALNFVGHLLAIYIRPLWGQTQYAPPLSNTQHPTPTPSIYQSQTGSHYSALHNAGRRCRKYGVRP